MKDKYYTPSIEEFHVGFEYEYDGKCVFQRDMSISFMDYLISNGKIRVKYLDKQDIESLGFIHKKYKQDEYSEMRIYIGQKFEIQFFGWNISEANKHIRGNMHIYLQEEAHFMGTVKNKSELKKILKQIGV